MSYVTPVKGLLLKYMLHIRIYYTYGIWIPITCLLVGVTHLVKVHLKYSDCPWCIFPECTMFRLLIKVLPQIFHLLGKYICSTVLSDLCLYSSHSLLQLHAPLGVSFCQTVTVSLCCCFSLFITSILSTAHTRLTFNSFFFVCFLKGWRSLKEFKTHKEKCFRTKNQSGSLGTKTLL